ncbi:3-hydroxybenzoate 6-monooxygenase [Streptomyces sp. NPDC058326]|uniref:3-hydroxybenzoate 6-monooxygenase n=1 Tax=Streptomyces sp. NPDC058326 TaxID=3346447 RepID=UPI0036E8313F
MTPVIVAGGGIGGLAAALGLARAGRPVVVLERSGEFRELGAGIQLGPNAFRALTRLGVGELPYDCAVFIEELRVMDAVGGGPLARLSLGETFRRRFGAPYAVVHRGELHRALLDTCREAGVVLRPGCAVERYEQDDTGVRVFLAGGEHLDGAALVGADGLHSAVRRQLAGDGPPVVSGHVTYRSLIPADRMPAALRLPAAVLWAGPRCHLVHYPLVGGAYYNAVITRDSGATEAVAGEPVGDAEVAREFAAVCGDARSLVEAGGDWRRWVLCDRPPLRDWQDGRVVLLGDAAHPMLQYAAQGACMALEDAACLSDHVGGASADPTEAFARYVADRRERTARVQTVSRRLGKELYHPQGQAAEARDAMITALDEAALHHEMSWLYEH